MKKTIDLYAPESDGRMPREDEVFYLFQGAVQIHTWGWTDYLYRSVKWRYEGRWFDRHGRECYLADAWFNTYIVLWFFRWYIGTAKVDGSRTNRLWDGGLGWPVPADAWVVTTTPKEKFSVRVRWRKPDRERPLNQGGIVLAGLCLPWLL
jgi:hypothetical protein